MRGAIQLEEEDGYANPSGKVHTCAICGTQGEWKKPWTWYGSYKELDDGKPILKFCSDVCAKQREEFEEKLRISANIEAAKTDEQRLEEELARKRKWRVQMENKINAAKPQPE